MWTDQLFTPLRSQRIAGGSLKPNGNKMGAIQNYVCLTMMQMKMKDASLSHHFGVSDLSLPQINSIEPPSDFIKVSSMKLS